MQAVMYPEVFHNEEGNYIAMRRGSIQSIMSFE